MFLCLHDEQTVFPSISKPQKTGEGSGSQFGLSVKIKHLFRKPTETLEMKTEDEHRLCRRQRAAHSVIHLKK